MICDHERLTPERAQELCLVHHLELDPNFICAHGKVCVAGLKLIDKVGGGRYRQELARAVNSNLNASTVQSIARHIKVDENYMMGLERGFAKIPLSRYPKSIQRTNEFKLGVKDGAVLLTLLREKGQPSNW